MRDLADREPLQRYAYEHPFTRARPLDEGHFRIRQEGSRQFRVALSVNK